jgi:hypothetical protein
LNVNWRLATLGDDSVRRFGFIVSTLRALKAQNRLVGDMARMLAAAEVELAKLTQR